MADCNYNCIDLPEYLQVTCGEYRKGGFSALGILDCDHAITDFTDATQYTTAIDSGLLTIITGVKAQVPEPTPNETENPIGCGTETILDGFERTVTWQDANVNNENILFYNALNQRTQFLIVYNCNDDPDDDGIVTVIEASVNFIAFLVRPASNKERQEWSVTAKYSKFDESVDFDAPAGIFEG